MKKRLLLNEVCRDCDKPCCRQAKGITFGTMLSPDERIRLEQRLDTCVAIEPMIAVTTNGEMNVLLYQWLHQGKSCPALSDKGLCTVYESRPLMCRAFPFFGPLLSKTCPHASYYKKNEGKCLELYMDEKRSALALGRVFLNALHTEHALVYVPKGNTWMKASEVQMDVRPVRWHEWKPAPNVYL